MRNLLIIYFLIFFNFSCSKTETKLFEKLSSSKTGISFANNLSYKEDFNIFTYRNYYNGGGVGLGVGVAMTVMTSFLLPHIVLSHLFMHSPEEFFLRVCGVLTAGPSPGKPSVESQRRFTSKCARVSLRARQRPGTTPASTRLPARCACGSGRQP